MPGFSLTCGIAGVAFFTVLLLIKDFFWIAILVPSEGFLISTPCVRSYFE
jgi:hypothetical protein